MGIKEWLFDPYEEPEERYVKNHEGIDWFIFTLTSIPIAGWGVIIGECYERYTGNPSVDNNFNINNIGWNSMVYALPINVLLTALSISLIALAA